jgi:hypothetical protein
MLDDAERARVRELVLLADAVRHEASEAHPKVPRSLWDKLNQPFIVTSLGGLVIATLGFLLQSTHTDSNLRIESSRKALEAKRLCIVQLAEESERATTNIANLRIARLQVEAMHAAIAREADPEARKGLEAEALLLERIFDKRYAAYQEGPKPNTLVAKARTAFESEDVQSRIEVVDLAFRAIQQTAAVAEVERQVHGVADKRCEELLKAMAAEWRRDFAALRAGSY